MNTTDTISCEWRNIRFQRVLFFSFPRTPNPARTVCGRRPAARVRSCGHSPWNQCRSFSANPSSQPFVRPQEMAPAPSPLHDCRLCTASELPSERIRPEAGWTETPHIETFWLGYNYALYFSVTRYVPRRLVVASCWRELLSVVGLHGPPILEHQPQTAPSIHRRWLASAALARPRNPRQTVGCVAAPAGASRCSPSATLSAAWCRPPPSPARAAGGRWPPTRAADAPRVAPPGVRNLQAPRPPPGRFAQPPPAAPSVAPCSARPATPPRPAAARCRRDGRHPRAAARTATACTRRGAPCCRGGRAGPGLRRRRATPPRWPIRGRTVIRHYYLFLL